MADDQAARRAMEDIAAKLVEAWNRHDARALAAIFADDADFTNVFGMVAKGRAAIEALHAPIFETIFKDSRLSVAETLVRLIRPDVASVDVKWTMTGARDPRGNPWPEREGLMNWVATRHGNGWLIDVSHNMDLPSPELGEAQAALSKKQAPKSTKRRDFATGNCRKWYSGHKGHS